MKVPTAWNDRFEVRDGHIFRIVTAYWYDHELDVYMESDDGRYWRRNMYQSCLRGWCVAFPGMKFYERGDPAIAELENWCALPRPGNFGGGNLTEEDKDVICSVYPSFRYTLNKYKQYKFSQTIVRWHTMEVLIKWIEHPQLEYVLAAGYNRVGMSKYFWRLKEEKRWASCKSAKGKVCEDKRTKAPCCIGNKKVGNLKKGGRYTTVGAAVIRF